MFVFVILFYMWTYYGRGYERIGSFGGKLMAKSPEAYFCTLQLGLVRFKCSGGFV